MNILTRWVEEIIGPPASMQPASADASFRRYFRVLDRAGRSYIVMDAPPEHESVETFARVAGRFREAGLNVPQVHALDAGRGLALLGDLGSRTYLAEIDDTNADSLYRDALEALYRLQAFSLDRLDAFEPYDAGKLNAEMELFRQWFVPCRTSRALEPAEHDIVDQTFRILTAGALEQPRVWVHRDYHSRNLMITETGSPGVLDFQDAVSGPVTYDLVSLLRDCYLVWPDERVEAWLEDYYERIHPLLPEADVGPDRFRRWFDWMGVQRHIKVLGIFTRLYHRDGKAGYLGDLPVVYAYVRDVCARYPELHPFLGLIESLDIKWTS